MSQLQVEIFVQTTAEKDETRPDECDSMDRLSPELSHEVAESMTDARAEKVEPDERRMCHATTVLQSAELGMLVETRRIAELDGKCSPPLDGVGSGRLEQYSIEEGDLLVRWIRDGCG